MMIHRGKAIEFELQAALFFKAEHLLQFMHFSDIADLIQTCSRERGYLGIQKSAWSHYQIHKLWGLT